MERLLKSKYEYIFEQELLDEIAIEGVLKKVPKGATMIDIGQSMPHMPLVLNGSIKIMEEDKEGHEYLLYYLEMGDSCVMTMSCCMGGKKSAIRAIAEEETLLCLVPIQKMEEWIVKYKSWRAFVFDSYDARMKEMRETIDSLAFMNMENRIYKYLKDRAMVLNSPYLEITHQQIANDLNTSRVVVSRLIKKLVADERISNLRNKITVTEFAPKSS